MSFVRDNLTELWLNLLGVSWEFVDRIPIDLLTPDWDKYNTGRPGNAIIAGVAEKYGELMAGGDPFPAPILVKKPNGHAPLDGKQRIAGAVCMAEAKHIAAYVIKGASLDMEAYIAKCANARNGDKPPKEYLIASGIEWVDAGHSESEGAKIASLELKSFRMHLATHRVRERLEAQEYFPAIANGALAALEPLIDEPKYLKAAAIALDRARARIDMAEDLVTRMTKNPGNGRLVAIKEWESSPIIAARIASVGPKKMLAKTLILQQAHTLETVLREKYKEAEKDWLESERKEINRACNYISGALKKIAGERALAAR